MVLWPHFYFQRPVVSASSKDPGRTKYKDPKLWGRQKWLLEDIAPVNKSIIHYHGAINSWKAPSKNTRHHQGLLLNNPKSTYSCSRDWKSLPFHSYCLVFKATCSIIGQTIIELFKTAVTKGVWGLFFFSGGQEEGGNLCRSIKGHEITTAEDVPCTVTTDYQLSLGME